MINERKRGTRTGIKLGGIKMGIYLKDIRAHVDVGLNIKHTLKWWKKLGTHNSQLKWDAY